MKKILPFFSYLFHPIFIPLLGTLLYLLFDDNYFSIAQVYLIIFQIIIITIFLPMAFFYLLKTFGKVDTVMLSDVNQRKIPLLLQIALTFVLVWKSITVERFPELYYYFFAGLITTTIAFVLLFFKIKSSIHMLGMGALTFFIIGLSMHNQINISYTIASLFIFTGLIATSRMYMKAHTLPELVIGYTIGVIPQIVCWYLWL